MNRLSSLAGIFLAVTCAVATLSMDALAQSQTQLPAPTGPVLLEVDGAIDVSNLNGRAALDREMLRALGAGEIRTTTAWTDGVKVFRGVPLSALLERLGAKGASLKVTALNDYSARVPAEDAAEFNVLLAMEMDGKRLSVRDKGPIWIVYPRDQFDELQDVKYNERWVWQVRRITVE